MKVLKIRTAVLLLLSVTSLSSVSTSEVQRINVSTCPKECIGPCIALGLTSQQAFLQNPDTNMHFRCLQRCGCTEQQANEQITKLIEIQDKLSASLSLASVQYQILTDASSKLVSIQQEPEKQPENLSSQYCQVVENIKGNASLLQTQLIASGMNPKCNLNCFKDCQSNTQPRGECFVKCGCSQSLGGGEFQFKYTPWTNQPNKTVAGFGQAWTCEGAGCSWNWHYKPTIVIPQVTPGGSKLDCTDYPTCAPNANDTYAQLLQDRKVLFRIVSIAMSEYIRQNNYIRFNHTFFDIAREYYVSEYENLITVALNIGGTGFLIKVERLYGYDNAFQVTFFNTITKSEYSFYAVSQKVSILEYNVALLNTDTFEQVQFNQIVLRRNITTLTGFNYFIKKVSITPGFNDIIDIFTGELYPIKMIEGRVVAALAAASQIPYNVFFKEIVKNLAADHVIQWKIQVLDFGVLESRFRLIGYTTSIIGEVVRVNYTVSLAHIQHISNSWVITIFQDIQGRLSQVNKFEVIAPQSNRTHELAIVFGSGNNKWAYLANTTFAQGYHYVDLKYIGNLTQEQNQHIIDFGNQKEVIYIHSLGNAIAAALSDWPLNIKPNSTTELKTIFISGNQGQINIINTKKNETYKVTITEVATNIGKPVFYAEITYPSGLKAGYYTIVNPLLDGTFQVAVLNGGKFVQNTYIAGTTPIQGSLNFNQITKLDIISTPNNIIDWTNQFISFQNQTTITWPDGVKPNSTVISINFTDSNYQLVNITGVQVNTLNQSYQIYKIEGLENKFIVWGNGSVFHYPTGGFICQGGLLCLQDWLSTELIISKKPDYNIAIDQSTGIQYIIFNNGTVTHLNGTFITIGGSAGLAQFLTSNNVQVNVIQPTRPTFQIITLSNGQIYHLQSWGGQITFPNGTIVTQGSLSDLLLQLNQNSKVPITIVNNETPKFLTFTFNGILYFIYKNGTVTTNDNKFITDKGIDGFIEWIKNQAQNVVVEPVKYTIVTDANSGNKYYVYSNNTVTYSWGQVLCNGGMPCLQQYLNDLYSQKNGSIVILPSKIETVNNTYKIYVDYKGDEVWITKDGLIFDRTTNKSYIHFDLKDYLQTLTFKKIETTSTSQVNQVATIKDLNISFTIKPDGSVFYSNGSFFTVGGVQGIVKIYNIIGKEVIIGNTIIFEDPNLIFRITPDNYIQGPFEGQSNTKFCGSGNRQEALVCLWNYLANTYYLQITGSQSTGLQYIKDQNGTMYLIFGNGKVINEDGTVICLTGGKQCLQQHIDKFNIVAPTVTYDITYINGKLYYIYSNGTILDGNGLFIINGTTTDLITFIQNQTNTDNQIKPLPQTDKFFIFNGSVITQISTGVYVNSSGSNLNVVNNNLQLVLQQQVNTAIFQSGLNIVASVLPITHAESYTIWENSSGRQIRMYANGTVQDHKTLEWLTAITKDYIKISEGSVRTNSFQIVITDKTTGIVHVVLPNGNSQLFPLGTPITTGGLSGLIIYLKEKASSIGTNNDLVNIVIPEFNNTIVIPSNQSTITIQGSNTSSINFTQQQNQINFISTPTFTTVKINNTYFNVYSNGTVLDLSGTVVSTTGQSGLVQYIDKITQTNQTITTLPYTIVVNSATGIQYQLFKDSGKVTHMNDTVICTKGGLDCLKEWLLEQQKLTYYQIVQTSDGRRFRVFFYGQVIEESSNKTVCEKGGIECLKVYLNSLQPQYQVAMYDNVEYRIYANGTVITSTGTFISDKGVEGLRAYIATTNYEIVRYLNDEYHIYSNGSVYLKGQFITSNGVEGLKAYLALSQYSTVSVGTTSYRIYANGSVYTDDTVKFVTTGGSQGLTSYLMANQYNILKYGNEEYHVYSNGTVTTKTGVFVTTGGTTGLQNYLQQFQYSVAQVGGVEYRVYNNGTVTTASGAYITLNGTIGLQAYIASTTFQTAKVGNEEYRIYGNGTVFTSKGIFVTSGGVNGLTKYIELTQYQVVNAGGVAYHIYQNGTVTDNKGAFITSKGVDGLKVYLANTQFNIVPTPSGDFRVYGNGTVTDVNGKFITSQGVEGLQKYITLISYQNVSTQQGEFRIYANGTVTDAKGIFVTNGGVNGLTQYIQLSSFQTVNSPQGEFRIYGNGTVTDVKGVQVATGGIDGLKLYLTSISFQTVQTNQGNYRIYGNGTVTDSNGTFVTTGGTNGLQLYFAKSAFKTYQTPQGDFRVYGNGLVTDAKGVQVATGGAQGLQNYLAQFQFQTIQAGSTNYRIYKNGSVYTEAGVLITTGGQQAFQIWFQAQQFQTAVIKGKNYRLYANGSVTDDTGKILSANGGSVYLQGIASGTIVALFSSDNLFLAEQNTLTNRDSNDNSAIYFAFLSGLIILMAGTLIMKRRREQVDVEKVENDKPLSQRLLETEVNF